MEILDISPGAAAKVQDGLERIEVPPIELADLTEISRESLAALTEALFVKASVYTMSKPGRGKRWVARRGLVQPISEVRVCELNLESEEFEEIV